jgi:hypothetical protein
MLEAWHIMAESDLTSLSAAQQIRTCRLCGESKPIEAFDTLSSPGRTRPRTRRQCRECRKGYMRRRYADYPEVRGKQAAHALCRSQRVRVENRQKVIDHLMEHPCVDCGEGDIVVLDFDHVESGKRSDVSSLIGKTKNWAEVAAEIAKCVVRCANCHRRKTAKEQGWLRWRASRGE